VIDDATLAVPNYDGNGMYVSWGKRREEPERRPAVHRLHERLAARIHGIATIVENDPLLANYCEAQFIVRITVREAFGNCPRYIHKYQLVERCGCSSIRTGFA